jgi:hypothetical protein
VSSREAHHAFLLHHLRLFGLSADNVVPLAQPNADDVSAARAALRAGQTVCAWSAAPDFCEAFGARVGETQPACVFSWDRSAVAWSRLRTLHSAAGVSGGTVVARFEDGTPAWCELTVDGGRLVLLGTDVTADLMRFRQGDPTRADSRPTEALWGIPGERPLYLFDEQIEAERPWERPADNLARALAELLRGDQHIPPLLPGDAPGAVVLTGDDDQAYLAKYAEQHDVLGNLPITYFLHPSTKHDRKSLRRLARKRALHLGLHPDALEDPDRYSELFDSQAEWFRQLTGASADAVRNHGFLNDGYWRHARAWIRHGVRASSNLPGVDGLVLNGTLLPGRLLLDGAMTGHWSILTALGDGLVFAAGLSDDEAAQRVEDVAQAVRESGIPGVLVVNLHPQNVTETRALHASVRALGENDFVAWNLRDCIDWFARRDTNQAGRARRLREVVGGRRPR